MRKEIYILIILVFVGCKKSTDAIVFKKVDSVSNGKVNHPKNSRNIEKSKPFKINGIECYWEKTDTLAEEGTLQLIKLKDYKTNQILVNHAECCMKYGFDFYSSENFLDVNFDGYKDFLIRSYGSTAENEQTNIYLFDYKSKKFAYSEVLSDNGIETDSINRKLITSSFGRDFGVTRIHYFNKFGKIKYTEVITEYSKYLDSVDFPVEYKIFEKIVNGKVVETKKDSVIYSEK